MLGLVGIGEQQGFQRRLAAAVGAPEGARFAAHRRGDGDDVGVLGLAQQRIECCDQGLRGEQVGGQHAAIFLGVEMLDRGQ